MADKLTGLLRAARDFAAARLDPQAGRVIVSPGGPVAWDSCCEGGQVWSRLISLVPNYATSRARGTSTSKSMNCGVLSWTATIGIGVLRCAATLNSQGYPPTAEQLNGDSEQMLADLFALEQAILCDLTPEVTLLEVLQWTPLGPEGGCVGGEWTAQVQVSNCACLD